MIIVYISQRFGSLQAKPTTNEPATCLSRHKKEKEKKVGKKETPNRLLSLLLLLLLLLSLLLPLPPEDKPRFYPSLRMRKDTALHKIKTTANTKTAVKTKSAPLPNEPMQSSNNTTSFIRCRSKKIIDNDKNYKSNIDGKNNCCNDTDSYHNINRCSISLRHHNHYNKHDAIKSTTIHYFQQRCTGYSAFWLIYTCLLLLFLLLQLPTETKADLIFKPPGSK